jgi:hypothetical protein
MSFDHSSSKSSLPIAGPLLFLVLVMAAISLFLATSGTIAPTDHRPNVFVPLTPQPTSRQ